MIEKFGGIDFLRHKVSALSGDTEIRFESTSPELVFMVKASRKGVEINGKLFSDVNSLRGFEEDCPNEINLEEFARLVAEVWKCHIYLSPKLNRSIKDIDL